MTYRNMLTNIEGIELKSLMTLLSSQSLNTILKWNIKYIEKYILPIYQKYNNLDERPIKVIVAARDLLDNKITKSEFKIILKQNQDATKDVKKEPAALAAIKCIMTATKSLVTPTSSLSLALYGSLSIAYDSLGLNKSWEEYESFALIEVNKMYDSLKSISIDPEPNPSNIQWYC